MQAVEKEKDRYYTVWKLIAAHGVLPQSLHAFGLISKMHREILKECSVSPCFWKKLRRNSARFAELEFDQQEWINFETLRKSPIAQLPKSRFLRPPSEPSFYIVPELGYMSSPGFQPYRPSATGGGTEVTEASDKWETLFTEDGGGKRLNNETRTRFTEKEPKETAIHRCPTARTHCHEELCTRRFLRLCYFPVLWTHGYKRVAVFSNIPQKFQESASQLQQRMTQMVLKYGRLKLQYCVFHSSTRELIWSVEAGRRKRTQCRRYWTPESSPKEPLNKLPWFKYQTVIAVCQSEQEVDVLMARKAQFRKAASIYVSRCASSDELSRMMRKGNEQQLITEETVKEETL